MKLGAKAATTITIRIPESEQLLLEFSANQTNTSEAWKNIVRSYAQLHGTGDTTSTLKIDPIPSQSDMKPVVLDFLLKNKNRAVPVAEIREMVINHFHLSASDCESMNASGNKTLHNRMGWLREDLKKEGLATFPYRGAWQLTPLGEVAATIPGADIHAAAIAYEVKKRYEESQLGK